MLLFAERFCANDEKVIKTTNNFVASKSRFTNTYVDTSHQKRLLSVYVANGCDLKAENRKDRFISPFKWIKAITYDSNNIKNLNSPRFALSEHWKYCRTKPVDRLFVFSWLSFIEEYSCLLFSQSDISQSSFNVLFQNDWFLQGCLDFLFATSILIRSFRTQNKTETDQIRSNYLSNLSVYNKQFITFYSSTKCHCESRYSWMATSNLRYSFENDFKVKWFLLKQKIMNLTYKHILQCESNLFTLFNKKQSIQIWFFFVRNYIEQPHLHDAIHFCKWLLKVFDSFYIICSCFIYTFDFKTQFSFICLNQLLAIQNW